MVVTYLQLKLEQQSLQWQTTNSRIPTTFWSLTVTNSETNSLSLFTREFGPGTRPPLKLTQRALEPKKLYTDLAVQIFGAMHCRRATLWLSHQSYQITSSKS